MNWQTEDIFERAKIEIADEGVFSMDQIVLLRRMIDNIAAALDKESSCKVSLSAAP